MKKEGDLQILWLIVSYTLLNVKEFLVDLDAVHL